MQRSIKIGLVILAILIVLGAGAYEYNDYTMKQITLRDTAFTMGLQSAKEAAAGGDYSASINQLQSLVPQATSADGRARLEQDIAGNLILRRQGDDLAQAAALYQKDIPDTSISPTIRAGMLDELAHLFDYMPLSWYQANITAAPLDAASLVSGVTDSGVNLTDGGKVYLGLLRLSDQTYPNQFAEYSMAQFFAFHMANGDVASSSRVAVAQTIQGYVTRGDGVTNDQTNFSYPPYYARLGAMFRANALAQSDLVLGNVDDARIRQAFAAPIVVAMATTSQAFATEGLGLEARFYYAAYLVVQSTAAGAKRGDILLFRGREIASALRF